MSSDNMPPIIRYQLDKNLIDNNKKNKEILENNVKNDYDKWRKVAGIVGDYSDSLTGDEKAEFDEKLRNNTLDYELIIGTLSHLYHQ
jgi:hypothetical protein